ncbi:MAG: hypothetical protein ACK4N5_17495, partial [Myxococcales bacterium]
VPLAADARVIASGSGVRSEPGGELQRSWVRYLTRASFDSLWTLYREALDAPTATLRDEAIADVAVRTLRLQATRTRAGSEEITVVVRAGSGEPDRVVDVIHRRRGGPVEAEAR